MIRSKIVFFLILVFLLADFTFSFIQYYNTPLYGELDGCVIPNEHIRKIFDDPLGFQSLTTGEKHVNPNRYFSHFLLSEYFQHIPFYLQKFLHPVDSVYAACAVAKLLTQLLFIFGLSLFITGSKNIFALNTLISAVIIAPLFQVYGFYSRIGINDKSILYTFFYAIPLVLFMLFLLVLWNFLQKKRSMNLVVFMFLLPFTVILPLSSPLVAPVILIISVLFAANHAFKEGLTLSKIGTEIRKVPLLIWMLWISIGLWSIYSLFLGFYNSNFENETIPLSERFARLPGGLISHIFHSAGLPVILVVIAVNLYLIRKQASGEEYKRWKSVLQWIGIFALLFVLLLPFGGYRPYRPRIIRYDMVIPVTMALIYYFGASTFVLIQSYKGKLKVRYIAGIAVVLLFYTFSDSGGIHKNRQEREAIGLIVNSKDSVVAIPHNSLVLSYENTDDPRISEPKAELLHFWNITDKKKLFYNVPE